MAVTWLGTSSGAPTLKRNVSCISLRLPHATFLVDAGEGSCKQVGPQLLPRKASMGFKLKLTTSARRSLEDCPEALAALGCSKVTSVKTRTWTRMDRTSSTLSCQCLRPVPFMWWSLFLIMRVKHAATAELKRLACVV